MKRQRIVGWFCQHYSMTTAGYASMPAPRHSGCGCQMQPIYSTDSGPVQRR